VVSGGEALWVRELAGRPASSDSRPCAATGCAAGFVFPIRTRGRLFGVVELFTRSDLQPDPPLAAAVSTSGRGSGVHRAADARRAAQPAARGSGAGAPAPGLLAAGEPGARERRRLSRHGAPAGEHRSAHARRRLPHRRHEHRRLGAGAHGRPARRSCRQPWWTSCWAIRPTSAASTRQPGRCAPAPPVGSGDARGLHALDHEGRRALRSDPGPRVRELPLRPTPLG